MLWNVLGVMRLVVCNSLGVMYRLLLVLKCVLVWLVCWLLIVSWMVERFGMKCGVCVK